jgi:hypothetical protein
LKKVVSRLPLPNRTLLQYLIHFLLRISFCSEVRHSSTHYTPRTHTWLTVGDLYEPKLNRMNSATLALVFGPELIRPRQVRRSTTLCGVWLLCVCVCVCVCVWCVVSHVRSFCAVVVVVAANLQVTLESHLMFGKIQKILQALMDHYTEIFF